MMGKLGLLNGLVDREAYLGVQQRASDTWTVGWLESICSCVFMMTELGY